MMATTATTGPAPSCFLIAIQASGAQVLTELFGKYGRMSTGRRRSSLAQMLSIVLTIDELGPSLQRQQQR